MNKNRYVLAVTLSLAAAVVFGAAALYFYAQKVDYERYIEASNRRGFAQLSTSLSNIDSGLQKTQYASGPAFVTIMANIWRESEVAKYALATLPLADARMEKFEKFVAQAGDFAFSLIKSTAGGTPTGDEQRQSLQSLSDAASNLAVQINGLQERLDADDAYIQMRPEDVRLAQKPQGASVSDAFSQTDQEFPEYASLIYDGPFSDHIHSLKPMLLEDRAEVGEHAAMEAAQAFLGGQRTLALEYQNAGIIPHYSFSDGDTTTIEVSKQGGVVLSMCDSRALKAGRLTAQQAVEAGARFLADQGFESMEPSYYSVFENIVTANFAYSLDGVIVYTDLIKVGIALDDGSVVRFDAAGYVMNHRPRTPAEPALTLDAAWADIPPELEVVSENTAIIPTSGKNEVLCFEFVCKDAQGRHIIYYINAQTGLQENVLLLIEDENGVLTI